MVTGRRRKPLGGALEPLFDAGAGDDLRGVPEPDLGAEHSLFVPEPVEGRIDTADLLAELGVVLGGERVPELDSLVAQALDLLMDLTDCSHMCKNAPASGRIPRPILKNRGLRSWSSSSPK